MKAIGTKLALQAARVLIFLGSVMPVCAFQNSPAAAQTQKPAHVPVLLMQGQLGPVTPPWNESEIRGFFPGG